MRIKSLNQVLSVPKLAIGDQSDASALLKDQPVKSGFTYFSDKETDSESLCNLLEIVIETAGGSSKFIF